jgi:23S rRNA (guanosine2251-2'-O)-methyltransferase
MTEVLYGRNPVRESLRAGRRRHERLLLAESIRGSAVIDEIVGLAEGAGIPVDRVGRGQLGVKEGAHGQGVALETSAYPLVPLDALMELARSRGEDALLLMLDLLQDPQNAGTLLRTAEAVGVHGIVVQRRRAVGITPAVVKASAGAVEHLLVCQVTNLVNTMSELKEQGLWVAGLEAVPEAEGFTRADLSGPLALVVGSEGAGMRRLVRERCDFLVRLPMRGEVSSLNAAVAASVVLYEVVRQRGAKAR